MVRPKSPTLQGSLSKIYFTLNNWFNIIKYKGNFKQPWVNIVKQQISKFYLVLAVCQGGCNNGKCLQPNVCVCYTGYSGPGCHGSNFYQIIDDVFSSLKPFELK